MPKPTHFNNLIVKTIVRVSLKNFDGPHDVPHHIPPTGDLEDSVICK